MALPGPFLPGEVESFLQKRTQWWQQWGQGCKKRGPEWFSWQLSPCTMSLFGWAQRGSAIYSWWRHFGRWWDTACSVLLHISVLCADYASVCGNRPPSRVHPGHDEPHSPWGQKTMTPTTLICRPTARYLKGARGFSDVWRRGFSSSSNSEKSLGVGVTRRKSVQRNSPWEKHYMNHIVLCPCRVPLSATDSLPASGHHWQENQCGSVWAKAKTSLLLDLAAGNKIHSLWG